MAGHDRSGSLRWRIRSSRNRSWMYFWTDLRGEVSCFQLRVPTGARGARCARCPGLRDRTAQVSWIVDADLREYFDSIPRDWLITFLELRIGDRRVIRSDPEIAERWRHGRRIMGRYGMGTPQGQSFPPCWRTCSCTTSSTCVPQETASECPGRRSDHRPLCRRYRGRVPTQAGCGAVPPRRSERLTRFGLSLHPTRPASWSSDGSQHEPTRARGGQAGDIRLPGLHALLHDDPARTLSAWSQTVAKRVNRPWCVSASAGTTISGKSVRGLGRVYQGWLNYFAVPGSGRFVVRSVAGCNACGCAHCAGGPREPVRLEAAGACDRKSCGRCPHPSPVAGQRFAVNHPR